MAPDAGSSSKVSKNRGFMAIPEVGDQVTINFQHNHPDRPFVMRVYSTAKLAVLEIILKVWAVKADILLN